MRQAPERRIIVFVLACGFGAYAPIPLCEIVCSAPSRSVALPPVQARYREV